MDSVAPEILHIVCSFLSVIDIPNFRLVGRVFADIGAAYMLPEVTFFMNQAELERLRDISLHPIFSRHVTSLTYFAWALDDPKISLHEFLASYKRDLHWWCGVGTQKGAALSRDELLVEYRRYEAAVDKQKAILEAGADQAMLCEVMPRFPNLQQITMSTGEEGFYETKSKRRPTPRDTILRPHNCYNLGPTGVRTLEALMSANADAGCRIKSFRAGELSWRFFKRSPSDLARLFLPLANLTRIELLVGVDLDDNHDSMGCRRVLGKGILRNIFKCIPQLEALHIEVTSWSDEHQDRAATLKDVFEPGFHWPSLKELGIGGLSCERQELMRLLRLHKDTLRHLCLSGVHLQTTSWRKLLPDIRKTLYLTHACICGDLHGQTEPDDEDEDGHNAGSDAGGDGSEGVTSHDVPSLIPGLPILPPHGASFADDLECWDLSLPELDEDPIRTSVNCYLSEGGSLYPDTLPLDEYVADEHFDEYVEPYLKAWRRKRRLADGLPLPADSDDEYTEYFPSEDDSDDSDDSDSDDEDSDDDDGGDYEFGTPRSLGPDVGLMAEGVAANDDDDDDSEGIWEDVNSEDEDEGGDEDEDEDFFEGFAYSGISAFDGYFDYDDDGAAAAGYPPDPFGMDQVEFLLAVIASEAAENLGVDFA